MQSIFDNLINGNLSDARRLARRVSWKRLFDFAMDDLGWDNNKAYAAADYLKAADGMSQGAFQRFCDHK